LPRLVNGQVDAGAFQVQAAIPSVSDLSTDFSPDGQVVTLTASLSSPAGPVNEGHVTFTVAGVSAVSSVSGGSASTQLTLPAGLTPGAYTIAAAYTDDSSDPGNFRDAAGFGTLSVQPASSSVSGGVSSSSLDSTPAASTTTKIISVTKVGPFGLQREVTVQVLDAAGNPVNGGSVTISNGKQSQTVGVSGGKASAIFNPGLLELWWDFLFGYTLAASFGGTSTDPASSGSLHIAAFTW
jgi:hypothetical protein